MFDNIGGKIKTVATAFTWIGIIFFSLTGLIVMFVDEDTILLGILIIAIGCLTSWLSSLTLYGLGQLIENSDILVVQSRRQPPAPVYTHTTVANNTANATTNGGSPLTNFLNNQSNVVPVQPLVVDEDNIKCPVCNELQRNNRLVCYKCGQPFINGQPNIPYWCKNCGRPGPYGEYCPNCGSTIRIYNK